jgi:hypothetical protein
MDQDGRTGIAQSFRLVHFIVVRGHFLPRITTHLDEISSIKRAICDGRESHVHSPSGPNGKVSVCGDLFFSLESNKQILAKYIEGLYALL